MIPKILHHIWIGDQEPPQIVKECVKSWHRHLQDFEIKVWSEKNLGIQHPFYQWALDQSYPAFASDYARLYVLKQFGGFYLDTDVMIFDKCITTKMLEFEAIYDFFTRPDPFKSGILFGQHTPFMASEPGHLILSELLAVYDEDNPLLRLRANNDVLFPVFERYFRPEIDYLQSGAVTTTHGGILFRNLLTKTIFAYHHVGTNLGNPFPSIIPTAPASSKIVEA